MNMKEGVFSQKGMVGAEEERNSDAENKRHNHSEDRVQSPEYLVLNDRESRRRLEERSFQLIDLIKERRVDSLVFLDRSARPLAWLIKDLWQRTQKEPLPDIAFVNIGRGTYGHEGAQAILDKGARFGIGPNNRVESRAQESALQGKWLTIKDMPWVWNEAVIGADPYLSELVKVFGDRFNDKNVLIVDDIAASGSTQILAIGLFTLSFPKARLFSSTSYFVTTWDIEGDRKNIPWHATPGTAGVLEHPKKTVMSAPITKESLQRHKDAFGRAKKGTTPIELEEIEEVEAFWSDLTDEELRSRALQLRTEMKDLAREAAKHFGEKK